MTPVHSYVCSVSAVTLGPVQSEKSRIQMLLAHIKLRIGTREDLWYELNTLLEGFLSSSGVIPS